MEHTKSQTVKTRLKSQKRAFGKGFGVDWILNEVKAMYETKGSYEDIINLPHHVSSKRPQMPMLDRAAQFSPFAALTGYDDAIHETGRLTDEKIDLSEEEKEALDRKQQILMERLGDHPALTVTYFVPDAKKSGGAYVTKSGSLKTIDKFERWILLTDGTKIPLDDVADIESELFRDMF